MSTVEAMIEKQKEEFANHTALFRQKVLKMYPGMIEDKSFDDRIHELWDNWTPDMRLDFINSSVAS